MDSRILTQCELRFELEHHQSEIGVRGRLSFGGRWRLGGYGGDASGEGESRGSQCRPRDATEVPGVFGKAGVGSRPAHRVRVPQVGGTPLSGKEGPLEFSVVGAPAGPPGRLQPVPRFQAQGPHKVDPRCFEFRGYLSCRRQPKPHRNITHT